MAITTIPDGANVTVTGTTEEWLQRAIKHQLYLDDYRKEYSNRRRTKIEAVKRVAAERGIDIKKVEADAIKALRRNQA